MKNKQKTFTISMQKMFIEKHFTSVVLDPQMLRKQC